MSVVLALFSILNMGEILRIIFGKKTIKNTVIGILNTFFDFQYFLDYTR